MSGPELSIIVPTFDERDNVVRLVELLQSCLADVRWELIVVDDDSPDQVRLLTTSNHRVRCLQLTSNFTVNNVITYRDQRLRGWQWLRGWLSFVLVCSLGALGNVGVASYLFGQEFNWGLSALAGILVGTV